MKIKVILLISFMLVFAGCSAEVDKSEEKMDEVKVESEEMVEEKMESEEASEEKDMTDMIELTLEELAEFDGSNGEIIYVAVDGVIYDVSELSLWKGGKHKGGITAGKDLTKEIKEMSPHGVSMLERAKKVGKIVD